MATGSAHNPTVGISPSGDFGDGETGVETAFVSSLSAQNASVQATSNPAVTFGDTTDYIDQTGLAFASTRVSQATPASTGVVSSLSILCDLADVEDVKVTGVIYADSAGVPGALLAVTNEGTVSWPLEQRRIELGFAGANRITVNSGTPYWIGVSHGDPASSLRLARGAVSNATVGNGDAYTDGPADPFGAVTQQALGPLACHVKFASPDGTPIEVFPSRALSSGTANNATVNAPASSSTAFSTLGAFVSSNSPTSIAAFESSAGINRRMPGPILDFAGGGPSTWSQRRSQINSCLSAWQSLVVNQGYELMLSLRPWPVDLGPRLAEMASGNYDAEYTADAQSMASRGYNASNIVVRPMWEMNGRFYPHSINPNATTYNNGPNAAANYAAGWRRMVNRMRAVIPGLRFEWSVLRLGEMSPSAVEACYPGDAYVDYIGLDAYNWGSSTSDENLRWTRLVQGGNTAGNAPGLQWHRDFSIAHGKQVTYAEWGVTRRPINGTITNSLTPESEGGDDDPTYMGNILDWFDADAAAGRMHGHCYFERDASDAWHQLHDYPGFRDARYDFFGPTAAVFDSRMRG